MKSFIQSILITSFFLLILATVGNVPSEYDLSLPVFWTTYIWTIKHMLGTTLFIAFVMVSTVKVAKLAIHKLMVLRNK